MHSLLSYPGSKRRYVSILLEHVPADVTTVVAPFFGSGAVEFALARRGVTVYAGDAFPELINFWRHVRRHRAALLEVVRSLPKITFRRFAVLRRTLLAGEADPLHRAAFFFVVNHCSFGHMHRSYSAKCGHTYNRNKRRWLGRIRDFVWPSTLHLHQSDYRDLLARHPRAFVWADPPYLLREHSNKMYGLDGEFHEGFDHAAFRQALRGRRALVTYNGHPDILKLYRGVRRMILRDSAGFNNRRREDPGHWLFVMG